MKKLNILSRALFLISIVPAMFWFDTPGQIRTTQSKTASAITGDQAKLVVQLGHSDWVLSVCFSADNKYVVTGSRDQSARLWELETGKEIRSFMGHSAPVYAVAISTDGKYVLTGSGDNTARLWETATGKEVRQFLGHTGYVQAVAISANGRYAMTNSYDQSARLWEIETGKELRSFPGHVGWDFSNRYFSVSFSGDGKYVLTDSADKTARLWEVATGKEVRRFAGHTDFIQSIACSANGKYVLTGSADKSARLWEIATGKEVRRFTGHSGGVNAVAISTDGKYALTGAGASVQLWEIETGKEMRGFGRHSIGVSAVAISPDAKYVLTASGGINIAHLWDTGTGKEVRRFEGYSGFIQSITYSADGKYVLTNSYDQPAWLWEIASGKRVREFADPSGWVRSIAFSSDSKYVLTGSNDGTALLRETESGKEVRKFGSYTKAALSVAFSADDRYVLIGSEDKTAQLWEVDTGIAIRRFAGHSAAIHSVAISADGKYAVTGSQDFTTRLWEIETGKEVRQFNNYGYGLIALSPDSKYLLTNSADKSARLWEIETGKEVRRFEGHVNSVISIAFSADGKYALTGSADNTARLWEVETGKEVRRFEGHSNWIMSVAFSSNDKYVLTGSRDSTTRIWDMASGKEMCSLISLRDGNWMVVAPDGRFDTNDLDNINSLHWVIQEDPLSTYPPEIFMRDYYEPRLLPRLLNGERFKEIRKLSELNRVQPPVKIVGIEQQAQANLVTVSVEVAKATSERQRDSKGSLRKTGVYDLRLFRDGQLVGQLSDGPPQSLSSINEKNKLLVWRKESEIKLDTSGKRIVKFENIRLPRKVRSPHTDYYARTNLGQVDFSAYAFNEDRVKSQTDRKTFYIPGNSTSSEGRAYVILFGVNACQAQCRSLDYAVNDVRKMQQTFVNKLKQSNQYQEIVDIPLIADYSSQSNGKRIVSHKSATKANLKSVCDLLSGKSVNPSLLAGIPNADKLKPATPQDLVLLFFSSHGDTDDLGNFYIVPYDIGQTALCDNTPISQQEYDQILARCISSEELSLWLRYVDAGEMMMIVDACHSAAAVENGEFKPGPMGSRGLGQLAYDKRMKILAATQGDNVAREFKELNQSLLSYVLTREGIEEERADFKPADQVVMMTEWLQYGEAAVPRWYQERRKNTLIQSQTNRPRTSSQPRDKRFVQKGTAQPLQTPSLFDFTGKKQDTVLFRKLAITDK
jgi:WD40 repeat protein